MSLDQAIDALRREALRLVEIGPLTPRELIAVTLKRHGIGIKDFLGPRKWTHLVACRIDVATQLRARGHSYSDIGRWIGRDHASVMNLLGWKRKAPRRTATIEIETLAEGVAA